MRVSSRCWGVWVTSSDGNTTKTYSITGGRGVESAFGWKAADDFNTLYAAGNRSAGYIWSDGTTMWVTDDEDGKLYAYNMQSKARNETKDFDTNGTGKSTNELVRPTGYAGIYVICNLDVDGDGTKDNPWDFGTASEYPTLPADFDGDVDATDMDP